LIRAELNAWVDGELRPDERATLEQHLANCPTCRAEAALLRLVAQAVRAAAYAEPAADMHQRLLARLRAEADPHPEAVLIIERDGECLVFEQSVPAPAPDEAVPLEQAANEPPKARFLQWIYEEWTPSTNLHCVLQTG
jgi:anti-sigma factor RsiW